MSVRAKAMGMASANLFGPMKERMTHSAIRQEIMTEMISQRASVDGLKEDSVCIYISRA